MRPTPPPPPRRPRRRPDPGRLRADRPLHQPAPGNDQHLDVDEHDVDHGDRDQRRPCPGARRHDPERRASSPEQPGCGRRQPDPAGGARALRQPRHQLDCEDRRRRPESARGDLPRRGPRSGAPGRRQLRARHHPAGQPGRQHRHRRRDRARPRVCGRLVGDRHPRDHHRPGRLRRPAAHRSRHRRPSRAHPQRMGRQRMVATELTPSPQHVCVRRSARARSSA